ncbi:unnamed protein product [Dovyalis caffra]|uniref:Uncharacterized protein n=1 Tax=Dovyalis caffra TaxID=77055 RepID=A0AAV1RGV8_9ROSI|nr:unnamed protein product [Dovyalis caffra]
MHAKKRSRWGMSHVYEEEWLDVQWSYEELPNGHASSYKEELLFRGKVEAWVYSYAVRVSVGKGEVTSESSKEEAIEGL